jgi:hypothetical protein
MAGFCHPAEGVMATPSSETESDPFANEGTRRAIWPKHGVAEVWFFFFAPRDRSKSIFSLEFIRILSLSVVEQEKGKKADQNPEHRTEKSEPQ